MIHPHPMPERGEGMMSAPPMETIARPKTARRRSVPRTHRIEEQGPDTAILPPFQVDEIVPEKKSAPRIPRKQRIGEETAVIIAPSDETVSDVRAKRGKHIVRERAPLPETHAHDMDQRAKARALILAEEPSDTIVDDASQKAIARHDKLAYADVVRELMEARDGEDAMERQERERALIPRLAEVLKMPKTIVQNLTERGMVPEKHIGGGGMGDVWRARDMENGSIVIVKTMRTEQPTEEQIARFKRESHLLASIKHDNIVGLRDAGYVGNDGGWYAMEYVQGNRLATGMSNEEEVVDVGSQVASGLSEIHRAGITHRDIKDANILREHRSGKIKIADFGIAKIFNRAKGMRDATHPKNFQTNRFYTEKQITSQGMVSGTIEYMAPETFAGKDPEPKVDIWALGVTLFHRATGQYPFGRLIPKTVVDARAKTALVSEGADETDDAKEMMRRIMHDAPQRPIDINPNLSPELSELIMQMLEKDPKKRPCAQQVYGKMESIRAQKLQSQLHEMNGKMKGLPEVIPVMPKSNTSKRPSLMDRIKSLFQ